MFTKPSGNDSYRITVRKFSKRIAQAGRRRIAQASLDLQHANSTEHQKWHGRSSRAPTCAAPLKCGEDLTVLNHRVVFVTIEVSIGEFVR